MFIAKSKSFLLGGTGWIIKLLADAISTVADVALLGASIIQSCSLLKQLMASIALLTGYILKIGDMPVNRHAILHQ